MITRAATRDDYEALVRLLGEIGSGDPIPTRERFEAYMLARVVVAEERGAVIGYALWRPYGELAHVVHVAVDQAWRGRRIGEAVLASVRSLAGAAGCTRWYLNVKRDNQPALRLYARCGFAPVRESWALRLAWTAAAAMPVAASAEPFLVAPGDDDAIAARLGIPVERIASLRARPESVLCGLREAGVIAGFSAFDPGYPGAVPFALARPDLAGALLATFRPHARHDHLRVTVEGDAPLVESLRAAGAELAFAMLMLEGDL